MLQVFLVKGTPIRDSCEDRRSYPRLGLGYHAMHYVCHITACGSPFLPVPYRETDILCDQIGKGPDDVIQSEDADLNSPHWFSFQIIFPIRSSWTQWTTHAVSPNKSCGDVSELNSLQVFVKGVLNKITVCC